MTGISARLDPSRFARVHRSFVVNLLHMLDLVAGEGAAAVAQPSNGMEAPVSPNYHEHIDGILHRRHRLTAWSPRISYKLATLGGEFRKVADDVRGPVTLSPDDGRMAFVRTGVDLSSCGLIINLLATFLFRVL